MIFDQHVLYPLPWTDIFFTLLLNRCLQSDECYLCIVTVDIIYQQVLHYAIHLYMFQYLCSVVSTREYKYIYINIFHCVLFFKERPNFNCCIVFHL